MHQQIFAGVNGGLSTAEGQACADPGTRTPIGASGNSLCLFRSKWVQFGITSGTARNFCFKRIGFNQWSNLGRPLFLVVFFFSFIPLLKPQKGLS